LSGWRKSVILQAKSIKNNENDNDSFYSMVVAQLKIEQVVRVGAMRIKLKRI
jgi:hypothetical protein